ncbi:ATP-binding protein [Gilvimarinus sp. 1_MG-2023]|uniref:ATP-binding protein n=1 Tax=Gilvimarinus sp. 1_MG-2023 TaxID=3062638 RepID=UPI0026E41D9E|nr:ATP-binding protein [Gilvimarinus sp. 1_MG-2023]MDO6748353.1 ATP-binding protein [Gilvimarinus sp. 1_MG-2023]
MRELINRFFSPTVLAFIVLLTLIAYTVLQQRATQLPVVAEVRNGQLEVGADQASRIVLRGEWRFYWQELLTPAQLHDDYQLAWLPARWHDSNHGTEPLPGQGYATYAVDIHFAQAPQNLGLRLPTLYRAAQVWINGELVLAAGQPGESAASEVPRDEIKQVKLRPNIGRHLQVVVQISSFHHVDGGMHHPIVIDDWDALVSAEKWRVLRGIFLMSSTLTLAIYLLVMWSHAHAGREYLYLGAGLFWYSVRIFGTEKLIYYIFPEFSTLWLLRAEYYGMFLCISAYILFIQALFPRDINYRFIRGFWWLGVGASLFASVTSARWFTLLRDPFEAICVLYILYFIGCLILIVWRRRPWSGLVSFLGGVIALLFVNEVLYYRQVTAVQLTPWVYIFVALTSIIFLGQRLNQLLSIESKQKALLQDAVDARTFELQRRLEELDQARRHALELAQKRSEFMAELSHEIRTPLSGLIGTMRLVGREGANQPTLIRHAIDAGESLLAVVRESLSASGSGHMQASKRIRFDVLELLYSTIDIMRTVAQEKGLALEIKTDLDTPLWVNSHPLRIRQIVSNLLSNAIKFTAQGGVIVSVKVSHAQKQVVQLQIDVSDTGIGIEPAEQEQVFAEYVQLNPEPENPGVGLGLAITRKLVLDLKGSIRLQSVPREGTRFTVVLPLERVENCRDLEAPTRAVYRTEQALNVLVVEDDRVNRAIVAQLLRSEGHKVRATSHPVEALSWLQQEHFQLCLFDIRLPDMSGLELVERSRSINEGRQTIYVALTANTSESDIAQYRKANFDYVMEKPVDKFHLQMVLSRAEKGREATDTFFLHNDLGQEAGNLLVDRRLWQGIVNDLGRHRAETLLEDARLSLREYSNALEVALGQGRFTDIRDVAHKIKSAAKSVGMISVANIAHHVESEPTRAFSVLTNLDNLITTSYEQMRMGLESRHDQ